jgi:hypothetical protein
MAIPSFHLDAFLADVGYGGPSSHVLLYAVLSCLDESQLRARVRISLAGLASPGGSDIQLIRDSFGFSADDPPWAEQAVHAV